MRTGRKLALSAGVLLAALPMVASPAAAAATWTASADGAAVTIRAVGASTIVVGCTPEAIGLIKIGSVTTSLRCDRVAELRIVGSTEADLLDARGVESFRWPALVRTLIDGKDGNDKIYGSAHKDEILGGPGDDIIRERGGSNLVRGGSGNDEINGSGGRDTIYGDGGNDRVVGCENGYEHIASNSHDTLSGGLGDDRVKGCAGNDTVQGNDGHDRIEGGPGNDLVSGGAGNDTLDSDSPEAFQPGIDELDGGTGTNTIIGNNDDHARLAGHYTWTITRTFTRNSLVTANPGGASMDLTILVPGRWAAAPNYDGGGTVLRSPIGLGGWGMTVDDLSALSVRMSPHDDRLDLVLGAPFTATVDGGGGTDILGVGIAPHVASYTDDGTTFAGVADPWAVYPIRYVGFGQVKTYPDPGLE